MEFNQRFISDASDVFYYCDGLGSIPPELLPSKNLDTNTVFRKSLILNIKDKEELEIPIIARQHIESIVGGILEYPSTENIHKVILYLYDNSMPQERRTFDSIFHQFCVNTNYPSRLQKITTNKGETYYGGKGLILDENLSPLIMCTITARREVQDNEIYMAYCRPKMLVSPRVFDDITKIINKGIVKKLIPFYTNNFVSFPTPSRMNGRFLDKVRNYKVRVIVDDFDDYFIAPIKPTPSSCSTEALNECLVDNLEDILTQL